MEGEGAGSSLGSISPHPHHQQHLLAIATRQLLHSRHTPAAPSHPFHPCSSPAPVALVLLPHALHQCVHLLLRQVGETHRHRLPPRHRAGRLPRVGGKHAGRVKLVACGGVGGQHSRQVRAAAGKGGRRTAGREGQDGARGAAARWAKQWGMQHASTTGACAVGTLASLPFLWASEQQSGCGPYACQAPALPTMQALPRTAKGVLHSVNLHPAVEHANAAPVGVIVLRIGRKGGIEGGRWLRCRQPTSFSGALSGCWARAERQHTGGLQRS